MKNLLFEYEILASERGVREAVLRLTPMLRNLETSQEQRDAEHPASPPKQLRGALGDVVHEMREAMRRQLETRLQRRQEHCVRETVKPLLERTLARLEQKLTAFENRIYGKLRKRLNDHNRSGEQNKHTHSSRRCAHVGRSPKFSFRRLFSTLPCTPKPISAVV
ncbi:hypothetical protein R5R35_013042 [Gryllus longicercus]|uniref:Uncharacterized protein n=1 Tax=Gryllus longicercus TaxID=2509291 RepID=A0AAN9VB17_9ORTH